MFVNSWLFRIVAVVDLVLDKSSFFIATVVDADSSIFIDPSCFEAVNGKLKDGDPPTVVPLSGALEEQD